MKMNTWKTRVGTALLALLLLASSVALTGCPARENPDGTSTDTLSDDSVSETTTDPESQSGEETETADESVSTALAPTFSREGGLTTDTAFSVEITAPDGYTVRYTTDGSVPVRRSSKYSKAIEISQKVGEATVLRAACFDANGKIAGDVVTQTYVTVDKVASGAYTVMLSTDETNLNAMYADVQAKVERAAHAEIVSPDGTRIVSQDVGLRLFGGSSRSLAQKSFKIIARKNGYFGDEPYAGSGTFTYPFFPERTVLAGKNAGKVLDKYDSLILRNGGNDSLLSTAADGSDTTLLRDGIANEFVAQYAPHVGASLAHFATVYLNGEYYGILELRENQNEDYVKRLWGVSDDDVVIIKSELDTSRHCNRADCAGYGCRFCGVWFFYETDESDAAQAEMEAWISLVKKAAGAVSADEATYRKVYEEVAAKIDLENVKEYLAISCYLCNSDWPYNNVRLWRYTGAEIEGVEITDGKFRFATRDMDMAMARYSSPDTLPDLDNRAEVNMFEWVFVNYLDGYESVRESNFPDYPDALYLQGLFAFLMRDDTFRASFADYCRTIASDEAQAALQELYDDAYDQALPLMSAHISRWKSYIAPGYSMNQWRTASRRIQSFIKNRPAIFLSQLEELLSMYES